MSWVGSELTRPPLSTKNVTRKPTTHLKPTLALLVTAIFLRLEGKKKKTTMVFIVGSGYALDGARFQWRFAMAVLDKTINGFPAKTHQREREYWLATVSVCVCVREREREREERVL